MQSSPQRQKRKEKDQKIETALRSSAQQAIDVYNMFRKRTAVNRRSTMIKYFFASSTLQLLSLHLPGPTRPALAPIRWIMFVVGMPWRYTLGKRSYLYGALNSAIASYQSSFGNWRSLDDLRRRSKVIDQLAQTGKIPMHQGQPKISIGQLANFVEEISHICAKDKTCAKGEMDGLKRTIYKIERYSNEVVTSLTIEADWWAAQRKVDDLYRQLKLEQYQESAMEIALPVPEFRGGSARVKPGRKLRDDRTASALRRVLANIP